MRVSYIPLHVHSEYSLSDSILRINQLADFAKKEHLTAIALTDRNNLYAAVKFYKKMRSIGVKPILGCDLTICDDDGNYSQLILLAKNNEGFKRLCEIVSFAYELDQTNVVAVNKSRLTRLQCENIIALSGGLEGDLGQAIIHHNLDKAMQLAEHWKAVFPECFYLQVSQENKADETDYYQQIAHLSKQLAIPAVATNLACFSRADEFMVHEARVCISSGYILEDPNRPRKYTTEQYLKNPAEMATAFPDAQILLKNSDIIAQRCNVVLDLGHNFLPDYPVPADKNIQTYLIDQANKGLEARLLTLFPNQNDRNKNAEKYHQRLSIELDVINQMGFPGYFLIVADFIQWAKDHDVPVGPGRGSGAGSLVAYALKITDLDPLAYDLLFERFLNPERVSMPDFDIDFCMEKRDSVIRYVADKYGHEKVSQIATHGTMAAKAVVRDVGRVMGLPYPVVDRIAKMIPNTLGVTLQDALGRTDKSQEKQEFFSPELQKQYLDDEESKELLDIALQLEGLARNVGKHAGGVVIAPTKLTDFSALYCDSIGGSLITQFDKDDIEAMGLVKFDFLGLRTLTVIDWAVKNIKKRYPDKHVNFDINEISLEDPKTFRLLKSCKTTAVFQLESSGMKNLIKKLQPDNFEDIIALVALFRPGPLQSGMVDDFINRKHGLDKVVYPHPALAAILETTYGVMVYQEQVMQVAQILANYSLGEADLLRRAMGKKKAEVMEAQKASFVERAVQGNVNEKVANDIFDLMAKFAEYGFNKSHSAAYALLSYQTAWLKAHYPAEFMAAVITSDMANTDKVVQHIDECQDMKIKVLPPSINLSEYAFAVDTQGQIVFGLGAVKGVGQAVIEAIVTERKAQGTFVSVQDLCQRIGPSILKKKTLEILIYAGAFDCIDSNRGGLMTALPQIMKIAQQKFENAKNKQSDMFGLMQDAHLVQNEVKISSADAWDKKSLLIFEKQALGLYLSDHPVNAVKKTLQKICGQTIAELNQKMGEWGQPKRNDSAKYVKIGGAINDIRKIVNKKNQAMWFMQIDDRSARQEIVLWENEIEKYQSHLFLDNVILVEAKLDYAFYQQQWRVSVEKIYDLQAAQYQLAKAILFDAMADNASNESINHLKGLRINNPDENHPGVVVNIRFSSIREQVQGIIQLEGRYDIGPADIEKLKVDLQAQDYLFKY